MRHIALILAAGRGRRVSASLPKQFLEVDGEPIVLHTMRVFEKHPLITDIYVVCSREWSEVVLQLAQEGGVRKFRNVIVGGDNSFDSIQNGIDYLQANVQELNSTVLVHDAVRPLVSHDVISRNIAVCLTHGNAITAESSQEAFMCTDDGQSSTSYIPRHKLLRAQTPHTFPLSSLISMIEEARKRNVTFSQSLYTLANELGFVPLYVAEGDRFNFKITYPVDVELYCALKHVQ